MSLKKLNNEKFNENQRRFISAQHLSNDQLINGSKKIPFFLALIYTRTSIYKNNAHKCNKNLMESM